MCHALESDIPGRCYKEARFCFSQNAVDLVENPHIVANLLSVGWAATAMAASGWVVLFEGLRASTR